MDRSGEDFLAGPAFPRERSVAGNSSSTCRRTALGLGGSEGSRDLSNFEAGSREHGSTPSTSSRA
jgi:hypothetical protein